MKIITYYEVNVIADCEGKSTTVNGRFTNEEAAFEFSLSDQGRDMYNRPGDVSQIQLTLHETAKGAGATSKRQLIKDAKAKLTKAEIVALGI